MKTYLILLSFGLLVINSCKKDDNDNSNANILTVSIDGTLRTFNNSFVTSYITGSSFSRLQIMGYDEVAGTSGGIRLEINTNSVLALGTYIDTQTAGISYSSNSDPGVLYSNGYSATNPITITITSIKSTSVSGTFQGDIFKGADPRSTKKILTNGQFFVKF